MPSGIGFCSSRPNLNISEIFVITTTKKCELTIVNEKCIDKFSHNISADPFSFSLFILLPACHFHILPFDFRFILWLLNNIVSNFRCLLQSFLCDYFFHAYTGTGIFGGPCIFDVSKLFPMKILLLTLLDGFLLLKPKIDCRKIHCEPHCP